MRHRNMYHQTGLPGWMRFGYSPGWVGRSPSGLGPCAQFLMTGQRPLGQAQQMGQAAASPGMDTSSTLQFLKTQAQMLEQQLAAIKQQIENLEGEQK